MVRPAILRAIPSRFILLILATLLGFGLMSVTAAPGDNPAGVSPGAWTSMKAQMAAARYQLSWQVRDGQWAWRAPNPAQGFDLTFAQDGFRARGKAGVEETPWTFGLALRACNGASLPPGPPELAIRREEAAYRWTGALTEWYRNTPTGVEHGLTIATPPPGGEELLELAFDLDTTLTPVLAADRQGFGLRDWSGTEILRYDRLVVRDAAGRAVPAWLELDGGRALRLVAVTAGLEYPLTVDPLLHLPAAILHASFVVMNDAFGYSVAISGDTLVVGDPFEDGGAGNLVPASGAVYVFTRNQGGAGGWGELKILRASDAQTGDFFGHAVAISGDTVVVGARAEDGGTGDPLADAGAAYVFARNQGGAAKWGQVKILRASDAQAYDYFGCSVAIGGDTLVAGAQAEDGGAGSPVGDAGAAYIFTRNQGGAGNWGEARILRAGDAQNGDYFGSSVAIFGDTVAVGAYFEDGGTGNPTPNAGAVYLFARNQGSTDNWGETRILHASDRQSQDMFGYSVAISGDTVAVGAWLEGGGAGDPWK